MASFKSDFLNVLSERGFIYQASDLDRLDVLCAESKIVAYVGYDATAPSLHVGNLLSVMMLFWLQSCGHKPIVLLGGTTSLVGDPSGLVGTRSILPDEVVKANMCSIGRFFPKLLDFGDGQSDALLVDNAEWLQKLEYIEFLRDVGRHFSVNKMLAFESVKSRLEQNLPISFLEFNYMILQGYDFVELYRRYGCVLQMGGSDQWGNMVNGIDLGRRQEDADLFAVSCPLITNSDGVKIGKSLGRAVWLCGDLYDPYDYWQYWRNVKDEDVGRFLKLYTKLPLQEIQRLVELGGSEINEAKKILATEATSIVHGSVIADLAAKTARETFEEGGVSLDLPTVEVPSAVLRDGLGVLDAFVRACLTSSKSDTKRQIAGKAIFVNGRLIDDANSLLTHDDVTDAGTIKLSFGKKKHVLLKPK